jgi:hypothetical protein
MSLFCPDVVALLRSLGLDEQPTYDPAVPLLQRNAIDGSHNSTPVKLLTWCMVWAGRRGRETPPSSSTPGRKLPFSRFGRGLGPAAWVPRVGMPPPFGPEHLTKAQHDLAELAAPTSGASTPGHSTSGGRP